MKQRITVQIPATSANLGPGFDVLGVALHHFNEVTFEAHGSGWSHHRIHFPLSIRIEGEGQDTLPRNDSNLVLKSALKVFKRVKRWPKSLDVRMVNRIPLSRGLGSSAAAVLGGLSAANALLHKPLSDQDILEMAVRMEGHADNVVPAMVGGFCVSGLIDQRVRYLKFPAPANLHAVIYSPARPLATSQSRRVLPRRVPFTAAVFTSSRVAFLIGAILQRQYDLLGFAMEDILHQPTRSHLVPELNDVIQAARKAGAWGAALSGAGSSIIALTPPGTVARRVANAMKHAFRVRRLESRFLDLALDNTGIRIR
ncbi:MAG: homoserine kinase [Elusimicrobiota bacterium]|jgi:homoserine kinase